jgi:4-hydroxyphenylpyruvate dioxygenase-like putative hemolysin
LDRTKVFLEKMGLGPFNTIEAKKLDIEYRGRIVTIDIKIALGYIGNIQLEIIEANGESVYKEFLDRGHEGLHHLGIYVDDIEVAISEYKEFGVDVLQRGEIYGVKWAYLDTEGLIGFILEVDRLYPQQT